MEYPIFVAEVYQVENPLVSLRKDLELSVTEFAILSNVSSVTVNRVENGISRTIHADVLDAVEQIGYDRRKFKSDYESWRSLKLDSIKEKVKK